MKAVAAILVSRSYREAAKAAGCNERTLRRWRREHPEFRSLLRSARKIQREKALGAAWRAASACSEALSEVAIRAGRELDAVSGLTGGRLVNALWPYLHAAERNLEIAGLLEPRTRLADQIRHLQERVRRLEDAR